MWTEAKVPDTEEILREVLDRWKAGIDAHAPHAVAEVFTADAIFQGLRPYSIGRDGVVDYYGSQPAGMTVDYTVLECRRIGVNSVLGYVAATFTFSDRDATDLRLGVVLTRLGADWQIGYYQASPAPG
jgi:uncharacterized protein (TIGR02246 family)